MLPLVGLEPRTQCYQMAMRTKHEAITVRGERLNIDPWQLQPFPLFQKLALIIPVQCGDQIPPPVSAMQICSYRDSRYVTDVRAAYKQKPSWCNLTIKTDVPARYARSENTCNVTEQGMGHKNLRIKKKKKLLIDSKQGLYLFFTLLCLS